MTFIEWCREYHGDGVLTQPETVQFERSAWNAALEAAAKLVEPNDAKPTDRWERGYEAAQRAYSTLIREMKDEYSEECGQK